jgi:hypothetical protein
MTYSLTGMTSLGTVKDEDRTKDSQLFQMPLPGSDSNQAVIQDLFGVSGPINIVGVFTGDEAAIASFITELEALQNGSQTRRTYHSDKANKDYFVYIISTNWKGQEAGINKVEYTINMIEGL